MSLKKGLKFFELVAPPLEQIYTKPKQLGLVLENPYIYVTYDKGGFCSGSSATELSKPTPWIVTIIVTHAAIMIDSGRFNLQAKQTSLNLC